MKKFLKRTPALLLLACAPCALAQTPQTTPTTQAAPQRSGEAVRERRVEAAVASDKAETPAAESDESKAEVEAMRAQAESAANPAERGRLRLGLAERLAESGRGAEAAQLLRSMLAEDRFDPQLFYNAGNALARLEQSADAAEAYRKAIAQRRGNYSRAQHNLGVVLTRLGRWEEAAEALRSALRLESNQYAEASYSLGRLHALRGDAALAAAEWERTLRLSPDHAFAAVALARALSEGGEGDRALALLDAFAQRAQRRGADVPREVSVARGEIVAEANVVAARRAMGLKESAPEASARGAAGAQGTATLPDATELLRGARASKASASPVPVVNNRAYTLLLGARSARADERNEEAVGLYRRAIREGGGYLAPANMELGFTLAAMRRHEEAVAALLAVVRKEGARHALVFYHLGRIYEHLGRLGEAGEAFARAAELAGEESPQFYVDLSRVREREGRGGEALSAAEAYVRVTARVGGGTPDWARERVESLRKKAEKPVRDAQPAAVKN
jgi:tetratricopeptide (TPR) repeat protein